MDSARYRAFLAATEAGSFSQAAEELHYTPSGVSQLVNALEAELGLALLHRSKKGVRLTEEGARLLPAVRELLRQEERIRQIAAHIRGLETGMVTIASYSSIATHWLPPVIAAFQRAHPGIGFRLMEGIWQEVCGWLADGSADLGFLSLQGPLPYDWIPLAEDPMIAVLSRDHPLAEAERYPLARCCQERFIMPALGNDEDVMAMLRQNGLRPNVAITTLENLAAITMIENGLGMSIMNSLITRSIPRDVALLPLDPPQSITLGIAVPSMDRASPAARRFVRTAVEMLTQREAAPDVRAGQLRGSVPENASNLP